MDIKEKVKLKPYWDTSEYEYYDKGYKKLLGSPGRVLQGREVTALSSYPLFILKDLLETQFKDLEIVDKINHSNILKIIDDLGTLSNFQNTQIIDENTLIDLEAKYTALKDLLTNTRTEQLRLTDTRTYIEDKNNEIRAYIQNFNNTFKNPLRDKLNENLANITSYNNYLTTLLTPAVFDTLFTGNTEVNIAINSCNSAIASIELFKKELNKIINNGLNKELQIDFETRWNAYKLTLDVNINNLNNDHTNLENHIPILDTKLVDAQNAVANNTSTTPNENLPEVVDFTNSLLTFENHLKNYVELTTRTTTEIAVYKNQVNDLKNKTMG